MDPVSIALGVAPLCLSALKGTKFLKKKIHLLRGYSKEVSRFRKRFRTQAGIFLDEAQLLLRHTSGLEDDLIDELLQDEGTALQVHFGSQETEKKMLSYFGARRYNAVKESVQEIGDQIAMLDGLVDKLDRRDVLDKDTGKVSFAGGDEHATV